MPELQLAEHLWPFTNEALVNVPFADLAALEDAQLTRCAALLRRPDLVRVASRLPW